MNLSQIKRMAYEDMERLIQWETPEHEAEVKDWMDTFLSAIVDAIELDVHIPAASWPYRKQNPSWANGFDAYEGHVASAFRKFRGV